MNTAIPEISQAKLKKWTRLADQKFRCDEGLMIAEGVKVVEELLASKWEIEALGILPEKNRYWERIANSRKNIPVFQFSRAQWQKVSQDKEPEGILAVVKKQREPDWISCVPEASGPILILHGVMNPNNLGALLRSAYWFGFAMIIISSASADYTHPKTIRASMGSIFHLQLVSNVDLSTALPEIKKTHFLIGSDVREGRSPHPLKQRAALLLGSESHGIPESLLAFADERWRIPGGSEADSLSLPQAGAIMMYEMAKKSIG